MSVSDHGGIVFYPELYRFLRPCIHILYGSALKLWFFAALPAGILVPDFPVWWAQALCWLATILLMAVLVGVVESVMARLRMYSVPRLLGGAGVLAALALILTQIR